MSISMVVSVSSVSSVSSASSAVSSAISMSSVTGVALGSILATVLLIVLLSSQEILSASSFWNKRISTAFSLYTLPLLVMFFAVVLYKIYQIV